MRQFVVVVVGAGLVLGGIAVLRHEADTLPPFPRRPGPESYRVLYRVEIHQEPPSITFEERIVRRPFGGRLLVATTSSFEGTVPGANGTLSVEDAVYAVTDGELTLVQRRVPASGIGDQSLAAVLDDAVNADLAERLNAPATVLNRPCRQFVVSEPGARVLERPTEDSRATICIDGAGIVLREQWELRGNLVLERTAVELDEEPTDAILSEALDVTAVGDALPIGTSLRAVDQLDSFLREPVVPAGFTLVGRYESATLDPVHGVLESSAWVMSRDGDFVVVEAGTGPIRLDDGLRTISTSGVGDGVVYVGWSGSEVRISGDDRRWVRVTSSGPAPWLEEYVATLHLAD